MKAQLKQLGCSFDWSKVTSGFRRAFRFVCPLVCYGNSFIFRNSQRAILGIINGHSTYF